MGKWERQQRQVNDTTNAIGLLCGYPLVHAAHPPRPGGKASFETYPFWRSFRGNEIVSVPALPSMGGRHDCVFWRIAKARTGGRENRGGKHEAC